MFLGAEGGGNAGGGCQDGLTGGDELRSDDGNKKLHFYSSEIPLRLAKCFFWFSDCAIGGGVH